jgi:hypothetical protein
MVPKVYFFIFPRVQIMGVGDQLRKGFHYRIQKNISKLFATMQWERIMVQFALW